MFTFENLIVYRQLKELTVSILKFLASRKDIESFLKDQLRRAALSAQLNLAEGSGRVTAADKKRFYVISRSSVYECVAILQTLHELQYLDRNLYQKWYSEYTEASKMLLALYRKPNGI